jgi:hypothetical protein
LAKIDPIDAIFRKRILDHQLPRNHTGFTR